MLNGVINVYKEKGYTSHDVVARLRGILGQKKIGHTGTLDPDAEGVLPVCLGRGTKLCGMLTDRDKTYEAVLLFGKVTDTQDISGTVLSDRDTSALLEAEKLPGQPIKKCIESYIGEYCQLPPMYSALKVNGRKLYELAREGVEAERKPRKVWIHDIKILKMDLPRVSMEVTCSKGTYIRTLCHDIGQDMGVGACMESLLRTRASGFLLQDSLKLAQIEELKREGRIKEAILPVDAMFPELEELGVLDKYRPLAYNGNPLKERCMQKHLKPADGQWFRVYDGDRVFIGIYRYSAQKQEYRLEQIFLDQEELR